MSLITAVVVGLILLGILLVLLEANRDNSLVDLALDGARFLVGPFEDVFEPDGAKARVGVNWGLAALVYALAGGLIARLLRH